MKQNFFSKHKALSVAISAVLIIAAVLVLIFVWKPGPIEPSFNTYTITNINFESLVKSEETILAAKDDYGMSEDDAKALLKDRYFWTMYTVLIDIDNQSGKDIVFDGFNYENKSGQHYFVNTASGCELGIPDGTKGPVEINVLINCNELDDAQIDTLLRTLDIEARYYFVDSVYGDYPENPKYKTLDLGLGGE